MKRRLAVLLACAPIAFGQQHSPPAAVLNPWVIDAVALDDAGRPVADLTAGDFEVAQGGRVRKITNFTWFDTRLHVAVSRAGRAEQLPALDLLPDEIRRNLVVVVDDLGLSPAGINAVRRALRDFVGGAMSSGDRVAILRGSGGSGVLQQLTGDTRTLVNAIDDVRYLGGGTAAASAASACWLTLGYALEGLRDVPGRKVVVVFAENLGAIGPWDGAVGEAAHAAHAAAATVYALHPLPQAPGVATAAPGALQSLARDTGGFSGADFDRVLRSEQGYYAIGLDLEDTSIDPSERGSPATPAVLKVRRPGVVLRSRAGFLRRRPRLESPALLEGAVLARKALASPFAGADVRARLTALFSDYPARGPLVEAILHFDPGVLTFIHDLEDLYHVGVQLRVAAVADDGRSFLTQETVHQLTLRPAEYRQAMEGGLRVGFEMTLPGPGAWQVRAVVADNGSDRMGSATQFVAIPDVKQGGLALSGLILRGGSPAADIVPADPREDAGARILKPGRFYTFLYGVFNPLKDTNKQSAVETQTRIFAEGRVVYDGARERVTFGEAPQGTHRRIMGQIKLDPTISPGDYILQVTVRDALAPPGQSRQVTQFTDFHVRE